jgi:glycosyltransferase involved in cell wall biosynthesis
VSGINDGITNDTPEEQNLEQNSDSIVKVNSRLATVLQVLPELGGTGGVERGTVEIAQSIVENGGRALVASAGGLLQHELKRVGGEHFTMPLDSKNPFIMWANITKLVDLIRQQVVDIIHVRSRAPAWSAYLAARSTNCSFVTTFHGTYNESGWLKHRYNSIMTRGARVIAISGFIAGVIRQRYGVPASVIRVIHRGVELERFDPAVVSAQRVVTLAAKWRLEDGFSVVMLPGRLTRWKGQAVFIEAIAKLKRNNIRCILLGDDQGRTKYRKELEALTEKHNLNKIIRFVDHCDDMPAAFMLADLVVSASTEPEAFGRIVPEAQAMGRPVIVSNHGGAREIVVEGETGWLTPPGDSAALAETISRVLDLSDNGRNQMAEKAIKNVRENFSRQRMCSKTMEVYNELLKLKKSA